MFCTNCGLKVGDDFKFCPRCGTKIQGKDFAEQNDEQARNSPSQMADSPSGPKESVWHKIQITFGIDQNEELLQCVFCFVVGVFICWLGWLLVDFSTGYDALNMRASAYYKTYGAKAPSLVQWLIFVFGTLVDIGGIAYAYYAWSKMMDHVMKYRPNLPSGIGVVIAVVLCIFAYFCFIAILIALKGPTKPGQSIMCVWDYLILAALCRTIWRFFVHDSTSSADDKSKFGKKGRQ